MKKILFVCALEKEIENIKKYYHEHKDSLSYKADFLISGYGRSNVVCALIKILP